MNFVVGFKYQGGYNVAIMFPVIRFYVTNGSYRFNLKNEMNYIVIRVT